MKMTDKKKPIKTMPDSIWESSNPIKDKSRPESTSTVTTDLQGNGYPVNKQNTL